MVKRKIKRLLEIQRDEGFSEMLKRIWEAVHQPIFDYGRYYVYENDFSNLPEPVPIPKEYWDALYRPSLGAGKASMQIWTNGKLAHISWFGFSKEAQRSLDKTPIKIDYDGGEFIMGNSRTFPEYRRQGFYYNACNLAYHHLKPFNKKLKFTIAKNNKTPQRTQEKLGSIITGELTYLNILGWERWKEVPCAENN